VELIGAGAYDERRLNVIQVSVDESRIGNDASVKLNAPIADSSLPFALSISQKRALVDSLSGTARAAMFGAAFGGLPVALTVAAVVGGVSALGVAKDVIVNEPSSSHSLIDWTGVSEQEESRDGVMINIRNLCPYEIRVEVSSLGPSPVVLETSPSIFLMGYHSISLKEKSRKGWTVRVYSTRTYASFIPLSSLLLEAPVALSGDYVVCRSDKMLSMKFPKDFSPQSLPIAPLTRWECGWSSSLFSSCCVHRSSRSVAKLPVSSACIVNMHEGSVLSVSGLTHPLSLGYKQRATIQCRGETLCLSSSDGLTLPDIVLVKDVVYTIGVPN